MKYSRNIITDRRNRICKSTQSPLGRSTHTDSNKKPTQSFHSARGGLAARGTVEPKIDGFFYAGGRLVRHGNFPAFARGGVAPVQRVHPDEAVFSGGLRGFSPARRTREKRSPVRGGRTPECFADE